MNLWPRVTSRGGYNYPDYNPSHRYTILPPLDLDGDGNLTPDPSADCVLLTAEATISRIDTTDWPSGAGRLDLLFQAKSHITNKTANSGKFFGVDLGNSGGLSDSEAAQLDLGMNGVVQLLFYKTTWILMGAEAGTV